MKIIYYIRTYPVSIAIILAVIYLSFFRPPNIDIAQDIPFLDKIVHFAMYFGVATALWSEFFRSHRARRSLLHGWIGACVLPILFSGAVEILQSYTLYRSGDWYDFLCNSIGAVSAGLIANYIYNPFNKKGILL